MREPARYLLTGFLLAAVGIVVCIIVQPAGLAANNGISYYGGRLATIVPYVLALGVYSLTYHKIAKRLPGRAPYPPLAGAFKLWSVLLVAVMLTPYDLSGFMYDLHTTFGCMLFFSQLVVSGWVAFSLVGDKLSRGLWTIQFLSGVVAAIYVLPAEGFELQAQVAFQLAFSLQMAYGLQALVKRSSRIRPASGQVMASTDSVSANHL